MILQKIRSFLAQEFLKSSFLRNSLYAILGSLISKGLNFLTIAYIAKIVGPKVFGEYNVIQTTVGLFGTLSGLGFGLAATRLIAEWKGKDNEKVGEMIGTLYAISFFISIIVSAAFVFTSGWISESILGNSSLSLLLKITAGIVIFDAINGVQMGVLAGYEEFKEITRINFITGILSVPLLLIGANYEGLTGLTVALLISRLLTVIITRHYILKKTTKIGLKIPMRITASQLKPIFKISMPTFLSNMATSPVNWVSTTIFVNQPLGYSELGTFNAANQLRQLVLFLPDSAGRVSIPRLANAYGNGNHKQFNKTIVITILWNIILSVFPALILYLFSFLFTTFIGSEYTIHNNLIAVVLLIGILIALTNSIGYIFICSHLIWYDLILRIVWGISLIIILISYGRFNGALGFGLSTLGAYLIYFILQIIFLFSKLLLGKTKQIKEINSKLHESPYKFCRRKI